MDVKPQRSRAALRICDENAPPPNVNPAKSLHQRTKSTSALSTLLKNGIKANPQRRTAFADVSNTIRQPAAQDDLMLQGKGAHDALPLNSALPHFKEIPQNSQLQRPTALLRPAQRPLSAVLEKFLPTVPVNTATSVVQKNVVTEPSCEGGVSKKPLRQRATTIFKENIPPPSGADLLSPEADSSHFGLREPVRQLLERPSGGMPIAALPDLAVAERVVEGKPADDKLSETLDLSSEEFSADLIQSIAETFANIHKAHDLDSHLEARPPISRTPSPEIVDQVQTRPSDEVPPPGLEIQAFHTDSAVACKLPHQELAGVQEYWEEEEDEEYYDAEGYTTARSFRSRGDNTTGGLTLLLEPRVTTRSAKELEAAKNFVEMTRSEEDIEDEAWDTSMVAEYGEDIFAYMRELEERMRPNGNYMDNQAEIQWSMRSVLMDWLTQVHTRFQLLPETLFLAVNYVDRFLSCKVVSLGKLQLVGATAIFVAAKYEEINCPSVQEIVYMVDSGYTVDEILKAERFMLSMLKFELGWPGPMSFLRRISKADDYDLETRTLAKYFLEVTIMDERFVASKPSLTAAAAHCLARLMLRKGDWSQAHTYYSQYTYQQLRPSLELLLLCCKSPRKHHAAVYEKYSEKRYKKASVFTGNEIANDFQLPYDNRDNTSWHGQQSYTRK